MITTFSNLQFGNVRVAELNNEPIFCLSDVCSVLGLTPKGVNQRLSDEVISNYPIIDSLGRTQNALFVNEDGLYDVILDSRKPEARAFRKWITSEVLPAIRREGGYIVVENEDTEADIMARALLIAQSTMERQKQRLELLQNEVELQRKELKESAHKVNYFDNVLQSNTVYVTDQIAKELGTTAVTLNNRLKMMGIIMKRNGQWVPTKDYCGLGYTKTRTHLFNRSDGTQGSNCQTVWTEKGREFLLTIMNKC